MTDDNKLQPYVPYRRDTQEGSNDLTANEGPGASRRAELNGWPFWEGPDRQEGEK